MPGTLGTNQKSPSGVVHALMGRQTAKQKREDMSDRTRATRVAVLYKMAFTLKQGGNKSIHRQHVSEKGN